MPTDDPRDPPTPPAAPGPGADGAAAPSEARRVAQLQVRLRLPDAVLGFDEAERSSRLSGSDELLRVEGLGGFVRCQLPVRLSGAIVANFAAWVAVPEDVHARLREVWGGPGYPGLEFPGRLANGPLPWGQQLLDAPLHAVVRRPRELPVVDRSEHPLLDEVLTQTWGRDHVLGTIPAPLPVAVRSPAVGPWTFLRAAGLAVTAAEGGLQVHAQGRTAWMTAVSAPSLGPAELIENLLSREGSRGVVDEVREQEGDLRRVARFGVQRGDAGVRQAMSAVVAQGGAGLRLACFYDDPADKEWALELWRSVRRR